MIEKKDITAFFKCLDSVSLLKGVVITPKGNEYTLENMIKMLFNFLSMVKII